MKKEEQAMDLNKSIGDTQNAIIKAINDSHLHPAIIQLMLQNILAQVSQAANQISQNQEQPTE